MISVREAAELIGCTSHQVRWLIRHKRLKAKRIASQNNQHGYVYRVDAQDARRYRDRPFASGPGGRPRGVNMAEKMSTTKAKTWTHRAVFDVLAERAGGQNSSKLNPLTWLYEQETDCAVLYSPDAKDWGATPLHLHPGRESWRKDIYQAILPAIASVRLERRSAHDRRRSFLLCQVADWSLLAEGLGLDA